MPGGYTRARSRRLRIPSGGLIALPAIIGTVLIRGAEASSSTGVPDAPDPLQVTRDCLGTGHVVIDRPELLTVADGSSPEGIGRERTGAAGWSKALSVDDGFDRQTYGRYRNLARRHGVPY